MAELFKVLFGRSKKRMKTIMVDKYQKCENYVLARSNVLGFHEIVKAEKGEETWRQKSATVGGNRCESVGRVGKGASGYISKNGFNPHT